MNISLHPRCLSLIPGNNINLGSPPFFGVLIKSRWSLLSVMRDECKLMISKTVEFLFHWGFLKCMVSIHGLEFLDIELLEGKQSSNNLIRKYKEMFVCSIYKKNRWRMSDKVTISAIPSLANKLNVYWNFVEWKWNICLTATWIWWSGLGSLLANDLLISGQRPT